jgi:hypothetical protein
MVAVAASGVRGYAGLGVFVSLPIIQLVYSFQFLKQPVFVTVSSAILVSMAAHFLSMAAIEYGGFSLGLDYYGYFDFLVIYALFSVILWESIYASVPKLRNGNTI